MKKRIPRIAAVLAAGGTVLALTACSHIQPSLGQYGIVTGHGNLSSQQIQQVVQPGQNVQLGSGTTTWYVPSDIRNYVTAPSNGDRTISTQEITGPDKSGPGMPDYVESYLAFELNPAVANPGGNYSVATSFLGFCLKYACATQTPQNDTSNASLARSSTPGWENMLNEVLPRAIDNATRIAIAKYPPSLWTDRSQWTAFGNAIAAQLPAQIALLDGSSVPYFCGPGSTPGSCHAFTFVVNNVVPADPAIISAYQKQLSSQYGVAAAAERLAAAKAVYGPYANWELAMQDLQSGCPKGSVCNFYYGYQPGAPLK